MKEKMTYEAPQVQVIEMEVQGMLAQSPIDVDNPGGGSVG